MPGKWLFVECSKDHFLNSKQNRKRKAKWFASCSVKKASPNTVHCIVRRIYHSLLNSCLFSSCHLLEIMKRAPPSTSSQAWQRGIIWAAAALALVLWAGRGLLVRGWQYSFGGHSGGVASDMANPHTSSPTCAWLKRRCSPFLLFSSFLTFDLSPAVTPLHEDMNLGTDIKLHYHIYSTDE